VCRYSCFDFLELIHSLIKQERMIEQGFKWTMVETQQQRENSRVEHCFFPYFLSLFISSIGAGQCLQPVFLSGQLMLRNANVGTKCGLACRKMQLKHDSNVV
jgi:hypothetical protein